MILYLIGLGAVSPVPRTGYPAGDGGSLGPYNMVTGTVDVTIGGEAAQVLFAGLAPGWVGLYQVNFRIPNYAASGYVPLLVSVGSQRSQANVTAACGAASGWQSLTTSAIGPQGGSLVSGSVRVDVPANALPSSTKLELMMDQSTGTVAGHGAPDYALVGLPTSINAPIAFTIDLATAPPDPNATYFFFQSSDPYGGGMWAKAGVNGRRLTATLPSSPRIFTPQAASVGRAAEADSDPSADIDDLRALLLGLYLSHQDRTDRSIVLSYALPPSSQAVTNLLDSLNAGVDLLQTAGLDWKPYYYPKFGQIPVSLNDAPSPASLDPGLVRCSLDSSQPPYVWLSTKAWVPTDEKKNTMFLLGSAHLVYHLLQNFHHPVPICSQRPSDRWPWMWMDEATGWALELQLDKTITVFSDLFLDYTWLNDLPLGLDIWPEKFSPSDSQAVARQAQHGRRASDFIRYLLVKDKKNDLLASLYNVRATSQAGSRMIRPIEALQRVRGNLGADWLEYAGFTAESNSGWFYKDASTANRVIYYPKTDQNAPKRVTLSLPGLSAVPFVISRNSGALPRDGSVILTVTAGAEPVAGVLNVLTYNPDSGYHGYGPRVGVAQPTLTITADQWNNNDLLLYIVNSRVDKLNDPPTNITITLEVKGASSGGPISKLVGIDYMALQIYAKQNCAIPQAVYDRMSFRCTSAWNVTNLGGPITWDTQTPGRARATYKVTNTDGSAQELAFSVDFEVASNGAKINTGTFTSTKTSKSPSGQSVVDTYRMVVTDLPLTIEDKVGIMSRYRYAVTGAAAATHLPTRTWTITVGSFKALDLTGFDWTVAPDVVNSQPIVYVELMKDYY